MAEDRESKLSRIPKLDFKGDYLTWKVRMQLHFESIGLGKHVFEGANVVDDTPAEELQSKSPQR